MSANNDHAAEPHDGLNEAAALRKSLEQVRAQAARELERLNERLAEREHDVEHNVKSETERLALQQELSLLRQTLVIKEQALDRITQACQRLEDQLEDRNVAYDDLQQEVERRELSLKDAQSEVERLQQSLVELQESSGTKAKQVSRLWRGLTILAVLITVPASIWIGMHLPQLLGSEPDPRVALSPPGTPAEPAETPAQTADSPPATPPQPPLEQPEAPDPSPAETVAAKVPDMVRDRLRDGSLAPRLAYLEGGDFEMGRNVIATSDYIPAHQVQIAPFLIGIEEVTFEDYDRFARATGRRLPDDQGWGRGSRPVIDINWYDAQAYVDWLSTQTGERYRLPSEAEWEFAARGGTRSAFWWGYDKGEGRAACFDCGSPWDRRLTAPVRQFEPNPFGLFDITGNVAEWVIDCYVSGYQGAPEDGSPRLDGDCDNRVARGGAFNKPASSMRPFERTRFAPDTRLNMLGFRVARDL